MCKGTFNTLGLMYAPMEKQLYYKNHGWNFSKRACEYAVKCMRRWNKATKQEEPIEMMSKDKVEEMLTKNGVQLDRNIEYNFVYVANMVMAKKWKSSVEDEKHLCLAVKDEIDDVDACTDSIFRCWLTKMEDKGEVIPWEELI